MAENGGTSLTPEACVRPGSLEKAGGQAVIEGVMMRSSTRAAVAVRMPDGSITGRILDVKPLSSRNPIWKKPVFRGAASLIDSLRMGMTALNWSAEAVVPQSTGSGKEGRGESTLSTVIAAAAALVIFGWLPIRLGMLVSDKHFVINLVAGCTRIVGFFAYVAGISLIPEIRRVFTFHGAEHQTIHARESGASDLVAAGENQDPRHQRCGTSFLFLVMLMSVVFYAMLDAGVAFVLDRQPAAHWRTLYHLPLLPVVMGFSYEILRLVDRNLERSKLARAMAWPGLLLQRFTTRKAGRAEVEVAVAALRLAMGEDPGPGVTMAVSDE